MTSLELQERKNWALDILQACNSEEAISYMESLARKLIKIEKAELKRPNCFTLEEVKEVFLLKLFPNMGTVEPLLEEEPLVLPLPCY